MSPTPKKFKRPDNAPLPKPNVEFAAADDSGEMTPEKVRAMFCNPIYAGLGRFAQIVDDETWIRAAARQIADYGSEQFLVNMLYVLRKSLGSETPEAEDK